MTNQIIEVQKRLEDLEALCTMVIDSLPEFEVTSEEALPLGLKPHTRSVSWIVEQVINQRFRALEENLDLKQLDIDVADTALHDLSFKNKNNSYYVNIKTHQSKGKKNKNDISAVEKLYKAYTSDPNFNLYYAAFGIEIKQLERKIKFIPKDLVVFSPQFMPIYVNPRNDKLQAYYVHEPEFRSREEFLKILVESSKSIKL